MESKDSKISGPATASVSDVAFATHAADEAGVTVVVAESLPVAYATVATAAPPSNRVSSTSNDDDLKEKYAMYEYSHDDNVYVAHEATPIVAAAPTTKIPYNTPYTTPYDADMQRRIAEEATRRGRMLSEQEIQDIRRVNYNANAINNHEQQKVAVANQNAF